MFAPSGTAVSRFRPIRFVSGNCQAGSNGTTGFTRKTASPWHERFARVLENVGGRGSHLHDPDTNRKSTRSRGSYPHVSHYFDQSTPLAFVGENAGRVRRPWLPPKSASPRSSKTDIIRKQIDYPDYQSFPAPCRYPARRKSMGLQQ